MKLIGAMFLLGAGMMSGCTAAHQLDARVTRIRLLRQLLDAICTELQCSLPLISELLRFLAQQPAFLHLPFLQTAAAHADDFPACWDAAIHADSTLSREEIAILETVGQTLGATTLSGQLSALNLCQERLSTLYAESHARAMRKGNLYRSIGLLGGLFVAILLL